MELLPGKLLAGSAKGKRPMANQMMLYLFDFMAKTPKIFVLQVNLCKILSV